MDSQYNYANIYKDLKVQINKNLTKYLINLKIFLQECELFEKVVFTLKQLSHNLHLEKYKKKKQKKLN